MELLNHLKKHKDGKDGENMRMIKILKREIGNTMKYLKKL